MALVFQYGSNTSAAELNGQNRLRGDAKPLGLVCTKELYEFDFDVWSKCVFRLMVNAHSGRS